MEEARAVAATGAISGAVGTYSSIDPFVETLRLREAGPYSRPAVHAGALHVTATHRSCPRSR